MSALSIVTSQFHNLRRTTVRTKLPLEGFWDGDSFTIPPKIRGTITECKVPGADGDTTLYTLSIDFGNAIVAVVRASPDGDKVTFQELDAVL